MATSSPAENLLPVSWGQLSSSCSNATEVAQLAAPSCSRPQPAADNGVREVDTINCPLPPSLYRAVPPKLNFHDANVRYKSRVHSTGFDPVACRAHGHRIAHAATQGIRLQYSSCVSL